MDIWPKLTKSLSNKYFLQQMSSPRIAFQKQENYRILQLGKGNPDS